MRDPDPKLVVLPDAMADVPPYATMGDLVEEAARTGGNREFIRYNGRSISFADAAGFSARLAHVLIARGIRKGDRVAILMANGLEWPLTWLAVLRAGAVAVPVNAAYMEADLRHVLNDSGARMVLTENGMVELVNSVRSSSPALVDVLTLDDLRSEINDASLSPPVVDVDADDLANLQYTSGTTGFPKACMLTHDYWLRIGWLAAGASQLRSDDVVLTSQPFSYIDPQWNTAMCLIGRVPLVVLSRFSASGFWNDVRANNVTLFYVLGTMPMLLLKQPPTEHDRHNDVRLVMCSGIVPDIHQELEERWDAPWREAYGLTESGVDLMVPVEASEMVGSGVIGKPVATKSVRIVDTDGVEVTDGDRGEIVVSGQPLMLGYWNNPSATEETLIDGWLHTGDLGYRDADGWFHIVGRLKDMVRRGGENISCVEVESVLAQHPAVLSTAVVAVPDDLFGEEVKAFIQLRSGVESSADTAETILIFAREHLAKFKIPRFIEFVESFPLTPSERIAKQKLLAQREDQRSGAYDSNNKVWL